MSPVSQTLIAVSPYQVASRLDLSATPDFTDVLRRLFERLRKTGATGIAFHAAACGKALYHTREGTPLSGDYRTAGKYLESVLAANDLLAEAQAAAARMELEFIPVCRLFDDYFPGLGSQFEASHRNMLWESRDGEFSLRGVLSLGYEEVVAYRLAIARELAGLGASGILFDLATCAAAFTPFRRTDFFGFEEPVRRAHMDATGQDIRAFAQARYVRGADLQIVDAVYDTPFDTQAWHALKGTFLERFLQETASFAKKNGTRVGLCLGRHEGPLPMARMKIDALKLLAEGLVDDLVVPPDAEGADIDACLAAKIGTSRVLAGSCEGRADGTFRSCETFLAGVAAE